MARDDGINGARRVADGGSDKSELLAEMRTRMQSAQSAFSLTRQAELDDLRFMAGSPDNNWQWPQDVLATRRGRHRPPGCPESDKVLSAENRVRSGYPGAVCGAGRKRGQKRPDLR